MKSYNKERIRHLFGVVPKTYELVNHVLTFGLDKRWRKRAAAIACNQPVSRILDCCSGTGEFAQAMYRNLREKPLIIAGDFSREMLEYSRYRYRKDSMNHLLMTAENLPFQDESLDLVTISFGVRNINRSASVFKTCLNEFYRVLSPSGRLILLETSQPRNRFIRRIYHSYIRIAVERIGAILSGSRLPYRYLSRTIPVFHTSDELTAILHSIGFAGIRTYQLTFGAVCIHESYKE